MKLSRFAQAFTHKTGIVELMEDLGGASDTATPVYMLGGGNPAQIPEMQAHFRSSMQNILANGNAFEQMLGRYDSPQGQINFIKSLAALLSKEFGWSISEKNIALTNGSQSSFFSLFNAFAGDYSDGSFKQILLPLAPEYIGYSDIAAGRSLFNSYRPSIDYLPDHFYKYRVDFEHFTNLSNIGAICVSRPTNPTGNVLTDNEINKLSALAKFNNIPLIIDGAYGLPFPNIIFNDASIIWDQHIILCLSLSKLGLPGVRTGIIIANQQVIEMISHLNAAYNLAIGSTGPSLVNSLTQSGELLTLSRKVIRPYYYQRMQQAVEWVQHTMKNIPVRIHKPEGALFLWLWFENLPISSNELYQRLKASGVYIVAGEHFFPGLENDHWQHKHECIRLSYAGDPEVVKKGIELVAMELETVYAKSAA